MRSEQARLADGTSETVNVQKIYALLCRMDQDVKRLEALVRSMKKQSEERTNT